MAPSDAQSLAILKEMAATPNNNEGSDSIKRSAALRVLAGPADGRQTDRLLALAIAIVEARNA